MQHSPITSRPPAGLRLVAAYHRDAVRHRDEHGCEGYPFADGERLVELALVHRASRVLELGTAIGFSAFCFASASPDIRVDTVDQDPLHVALARSTLRRYGVADRVTVHQRDFASALTELVGPFDLVFIDGFAADLSLLEQVTSKASGAIVSANLSWSSTTRAYLACLDDMGWDSVRHGDIAISTRRTDVPR